MIFKGNEFDIVMSYIKIQGCLKWKWISEFIDALLELYYMKRRFGYYFQEKDIEIVDNKPAIFVPNDIDDYKTIYLEEIDEGHPYITENEKKKINFIKKSPNIFKKIYLLKTEIFNSDYYGIFSDVANYTFFDCSYFFNKHDIDKEFEENLRNGDYVYFFDGVFEIKDRYDYYSAIKEFYSYVKGVCFDTYKSLKDLILY